MTNQLRYNTLLNYIIWSVRPNGRHFARTEDIITVYKNDDTGVKITEAVTSAKNGSSGRGQSSDQIAETLV